MPRSGGLPGLGHEGRHPWSARNTTKPMPHHCNWQHWLYGHGAYALFLSLLKAVLTFLARCGQASTVHKVSQARPLPQLRQQRRAAPIPRMHTRNVYAQSCAAACS